MGITVVTTRAAANTGTGEQTISTTDLGGLTPKAVLLIATRAVTDGTAADGAGFYFGASDGTNEITGAYEAEHAQASMDLSANQDTTADRILTIYDGTASGTVEATADFVSFGSNGVTINWTDAPASAFLITATFFAGSDLTANVGRQDLGNTADALIDITAVGFEADNLITFWNHSSLDFNENLSIGVVHNDRAGTITQRCVTHTNRHGFSSSQASLQMRGGNCIAKLLQNNGALDWMGTATAFDSSGFSVQLGNARQPVNADIAWIALRYGTSPVVDSKVYTLSTPTGTGSATDTGAGFTPQFVMYLPSRAAAADTSETDADAGAVGMVTVDADEVYTNAIADEDAAADSNTQSLSDDSLVLTTHTGAAGHAATFTSFGATGVTWNWTATDGTARLWPALAIEAGAGGGTEYMQSVAGTMTSGGNLIKQTGKGLVGTLTSGGVIAALRTAYALLVGTLTSSGTVTSLRTAYTLLVGTLTSGGTLTKQTSKGLDGTLTSSGALNTIRTFILSLAGTLTSGGTLTKQTNKNLAGVLTSSGTLAAIRTFLLSLAGTLTSGGALTKHTSKGLAGTLSSSGVVTTLRTAVASFAGTFTSSGLLSKQTNKGLAGTFTSSGALGVISTFLLSLAGTFTSSGALSKRTGKGLAGTLTSSGAVIKQAAKGLAGTFTSGGVLVKQTSKNLAGVFTSSGTLAAIRTFLLSLAGTLTSSGILSKQTNKGLSGLLTSGGTLVKQTAKGLAGILTSSGSIVKRTAVRLAGTFTSSGVLAAVLGGAAAALISLTVRARDFTLSAKTRAFSLSAKIRDFTLTAKDRN